MNKLKIKGCTLSFDVEEWFQVENLRGAIKKNEWESKTSSVEKNTDIIMEILSENNISATFFILGWIAEKNPNLVKVIARNGHEIASHGNTHDLTYDLSAEQLRTDISISKTKLENLIGNEISGYRAPNFSINDRLVDILIESGFKYDSSYNPFKLNKRYGSLNIPMSPIGDIYIINDTLYEIPLSTLGIFSLQFPIAGGAYFRLLPSFLFKQFVKKEIQKNNFYNFYLHPWEFEPGQPRIKNIKFNYKIRHYTGLKNTAKKFSQFILFLKGMNCEFLTMSNYISDLKNLENE